MSPRAASRLEALGFQEVYDYAAGKADWAAAGLPREGHAAAIETAGDAADTTAPTCRLDEDLEGVRARVRGTGWYRCLVVDDQRVVLGRLGRHTLNAEDNSSVGDAMDNGPSTIRPNV